jgi:hypothetical protein
VRFAVAVGADEREAAAAAGEALDVEGTAADRIIRSGGAAGESDEGGEEARGKSDAFDGMEAVGELGGELLGEARGKDFDVDRKRVGRRSERGGKGGRRGMEIGVREEIGGGGELTEVPLARLSRNQMPTRCAFQSGKPCCRSCSRVTVSSWTQPEERSGSAKWRWMDVVAKDLRFCIFSQKVSEYYEKVQR